MAQRAMSAEEYKGSGKVWSSISRLAGLLACARRGTYEWTIYGFESPKIIQVEKNSFRRCLDFLLLVSFLNAKPLTLRRPATFASQPTATEGCRVWDSGFRFKGSVATFSRLRVSS